MNAFFTLYASPWPVVELPALTIKYVLYLGSIVTLSANKEIYIYIYIITQYEKIIFCKVTYKHNGRRSQHVSMTQSIHHTEDHQKLSIAPDMEPRIYPLAFRRQCDPGNIHLDKPILHYFMFLYIPFTIISYKLGWLLGKSTENQLASVAIACSYRICSLQVRFFIRCEKERK